jgi:hypothetical protein
VRTRGDGRIGRTTRTTIDRSRDARTRSNDRIRTRSSDDRRSGVRRAPARNDNPRVRDRTPSRDRSRATAPRSSTRSSNEGSRTRSSSGDRSRSDSSSGRSRSRGNSNDDGDSR